MPPRTGTVLDRESYFQEYMRSKALASAESSHKAVAAETKKLLTDRGAYILFLEVQLERVAAACLPTQDLEAQLHALHIAVEATEAKIGAVTKLLKLHQAHAGEMSQSAADDVEALQAVVDGIKEMAVAHGASTTGTSGSRRWTGGAAATLTASTRSWTRRTAP